MVAFVHWLQKVKMAAVKIEAGDAGIAKLRLIQSKCIITITVRDILIFIGNRVHTITSNKALQIQLSLLNNFQKYLSFPSWVSCRETYRQFHYVD